MQEPDEATVKQMRAATPGQSAWVAANAGSGKTRVLTDRVARLLLRGTPPERILCLTFTKAAAAEMQNRLYKRLGEWAMMREEQLIEALSELGEDTAAIDLPSARTLFASAIETPGGLKIQTIHAFCDRLLKQFPLEAGVPAQFETRDDRAAIELHEDVMNAIARDPMCEPALRGFLADVLREDLSPILTPIVENPSAARALGNGPKPEIPPEFELLESELGMLKKLRPFLLEGSQKDQEMVPKLDELLCSQDETKKLELAIELFLTKEGSSTPFGPKPYPPTKDTLKVAGIDESQIDDLKNKVFVSRDLLASYLDGLRERSIGMFANLFLDRLDQIKAERGVLEFSDLIARAKALLTRSDMAQWVLYKLDGGIDHILVDEAQDTSQDQWDIIEALTEDFMSGADSDIDRSLFVVGDAKQSIYSFQGASPTAFKQMKGRFQDKLETVGTPLFEQGLLHSFRSSRAVLNLVDTVFGGQAGGQFSEDIEHIPWDSRKPGVVELWPYKTEDDHSAEPPWFEPLDMPAPSDPRLALSSEIADRVKALTSGGTLITVGKDTRPARPGDILILVQRRRLIFSAILSELKARGIPVAGADRLRISEELGVQDILSLLRFVNLPEDDLSLAEVLRSPLCGLSEADLFALAHGRKGSLWQVLRTSEAHPETRAFLQDMRDKADFMRPYELIETCLTTHHGRERMLARLGHEVEDALNELLAQALVFEQNAVPDLASFLHWFEGGDVEIKRDLDSDRDEVRIMTIHGAKGLEAPIVILPETGPRKATSAQEDLRKLEDGSLIWPNAHPYRHRPHLDALAHLAARAAEEDKRLLYVALTRAESWLIIAGAGRALSEKSKSPCWYQIMSDALDALGALAGPDGVRRFETGDWPIRAEAKDRLSRTPAKLPEHILGPAPKPSPAIPHLTPSDVPGAKSMPGTSEDADAMMRGTVLHKLLEILSGCDPTDRPAVGAAITDDHPEGPSLIANAIDLLDQANLQERFENALHEVPFTVEVKGKMLEGIFDLIRITSNRIEITDFKSKALVPDEAAQIPEGIINQMALYREAARMLYPQHKIDCAILWTETGTLMTIPDGILTAALGNISVA